MALSDLPAYSPALNGTILTQYSTVYLKLLLDMRRIFGVLKGRIQNLGPASPVQDAVTSSSRARICDLYSITMTLREVEDSEGEKGEALEDAPGARGDEGQGGGKSIFHMDRSESARTAEKREELVSYIAQRPGNSPRR